MKTQLSPEDKIRAAYFHHILGMDQSLVATVLEITNHGRVNEAIKAVEKAVGLNSGGYKDK